MSPAAAFAELRPSALTGNAGDRAFGRALVQGSSMASSIRDVFEWGSFNGFRSQEAAPETVASKVAVESTFEDLGERLAREAGLSGLVAFQCATAIRKDVAQAALGRKAKDLSDQFSGCYECAMAGCMCITATSPLAGG